MAPERYVQGQRVSTANDLSQITTKVQALNISDSRRGRETTSHRYNDRSVDEDGFTTVRHGQKPTNEGGYTRRRIEPRGAGTLNRDVREQQASDPDTDAGNDSRSRRLPRDQFKPGLIVRAALHEQDFLGAAGATNPTMNTNITQSRFGRIHTKYRKMIVAACYEDHYVAIPCFTHNGNGLKYKRERNEYVSIFDHRNPSRLKALTDHGALRTDYLEADVHPFDPLTTAHLTYPCPRKYSLKVVYEGYLDQRSTDLLVSLCHQYFPYPPR